MRIKKALLVEMFCAFVFVSIMLAVMAAPFLIALAMVCEFAKGPYR